MENPGQSSVSEAHNKETTIVHEVNGIAPAQWSVMVQFMATVLFLFSRLFLERMNTETATVLRNTQELLIEEVRKLK